VSPLEPAADAVVIDTSSLGIEAVLAAVLAEARRVLPDVGTGSEGAVAGH
jgi:cytidylate kinase